MSFARRNRFVLYKMTTATNKIVRMVCELKSITSVMAVKISWRNILQFIRYEGVSYPTHFLKIGGGVIKINFRRN